MYYISTTNKNILIIKKKNREIINTMQKLPNYILNSSIQQ